MNKKYILPSQVEFAHTDFKLRLKLYELVNKMQESSTLHAEELGMGYETLASQNLGWVISRYRIKIDKYPKYNEKITIETWPSGVDRILAMRNFNIYNEEKEKIGSIYSAYVLIDATTGRIQRTNKLTIELPVLDTGKKEEDMKKININDDENLLLGTYKRQVRYTDIDVNMHMNNACYVKWIEDAFPMDMYKTKQISKMQVNFVSGAQIGEIVDIYTYKNPDIEDGYYVKGVETKTKRDVFQADVRWCDIKE